MIVDASAVVSIFLRRPGHERLIEALADGGKAGIGAPSLAEASVEIASETGSDVGGMVARFVQVFDLSVIPFSDVHARAALEAFERFGPKPKAKAKGLDFGDCLSYATARLARQPLLADDERFGMTDLTVA